MFAQLPKVEINLEQMQLLLLFVLPGVIAYRTYTYFEPRKETSALSIFEMVATSCFNALLWSWLLLHFFSTDFLSRKPLCFVLYSLLVLVASPIGLGCLWAWLRRREFMVNRFGHPHKSAWDNFFKRRKICWVIFHLKNGKMMGGWLGPDSYITSYPDEPEVYVQSAFRIDEKGVFETEPVDKTMGMVVKQSDCYAIEFLTQEEANVGKTGQPPAE